MPTMCQPQKNQMIRKLNKLSILILYIQSAQSLPPLLKGNLFFKAELLTFGLMKTFSVLFSVSCLVSESTARLTLNKQVIDKCSDLLLACRLLNLKHTTKEDVLSNL